MLDPSQLLILLQFASPALPIGAYSYSEGLETLVAAGHIESRDSLRSWIEQELRYGAIRLEAAVMLRAVQSVLREDWAALAHWNSWLAATRETTELREQSWQMGRSLLRLLVNLQPSLQVVATQLDAPAHYAIAFGIAVAHWQIEPEAALLGYLQSWTTNLTTVGVKLIPLGQTDGQQVLLELRSRLVAIAQEILTLTEEALETCGWGLSVASMSHEIQYTRLFRS